MKAKNLLKLIQSQIVILQEAVEVKNSSQKEAVEVRDLNIRALGEKLSALRMKETMNKPFFVLSADDQKRQPEAMVRSCDVKTLSPDRRMKLQNEMFREMARLSLAPMGLASKDLKEQTEQLAASLKLSHMHGAENMASIEKKTMELISTSIQKNVSPERTRDFLLKKNVPEEIVDRCFRRFQREAGGSMSPDSLSFDCRSSLRSNLQRCASDRSDISDYDYDMPVTFGK